MNKVVITLNEEDLIELQITLLDEDAPGALAFLKTRIAAKLPTKGDKPCDSSRLNSYLPNSDISGGA